VLESLRLHSDRFATLQVLAHRPDILPRGHIDELSKFLPNFDLLTGVDGELEVLWSLEDQDDGATQAEPTHLLSGSQGLTLEERRSGGVHGFTVASWGWKLSAFVRSEVL
jgi:hypothetical protein